MPLEGVFITYSPQEMGACRAAWGSTRLVRKDESYHRFEEAKAT